MSVMRTDRHHPDPNWPLLVYLVVCVTLILALMVWQIATTGTL